jgi:hypothetical protein
VLGGFQQLFVVAPGERLRAQLDHALGSAASHGNDGVRRCPEKIERAHLAAAQPSAGDEHGRVTPR